MAYNKSKEENEPELLAKTILALANNSFNRADYAQADDYVLQLEQLLKIVQKSYLSGALALFEARLRLEEGRLDDSLKKFKFANESLQKKNCWNLYGYILLGKGRVYKKMGDFDRALTYFTLASESIDRLSFRRLSSLIDSEISDVNDSSVDLYLDRENRKVKERSLGTIDFKHRFVLLEILFLLAKNAGSYFDKEELAKSIWKDEYNPLIHDKLIYTSVSRLRKLIEPKNEKGQKRKYIVRGKDGYTFNSMAKIRFHMESNSSVDKSIGNVELSSPV
jgi:tetratricopeptide (TPR) repeat protein